MADKTHIWESDEASRAAMLKLVAALPDCESCATIAAVQLVGIVLLASGVPVASVDQIKDLLMFLSVNGANTEIHIPEPLSTPPTTH